MPNHHALLQVFIPTNDNEYIELLLPLTFFNKIDLRKLKSCIGNNIKVYYCKKGTNKIEMMEKIKHRLKIFKADNENKSQEAAQANNFNTNILEQIESITSKDIATILAKNFGGIRIYIPKIAKDDHHLALLIGKDALETIIQKIGGGYLMIPASSYRCAGSKAPLIAKLLKHGVSVKKVAILANCCERTVWLHKRKQKELLLSVRED